MIKIDGNILSKKPFEGQKLIQHLVEYNGPLASLFEFDGEYYIWWWLDVDDVSNRWGVMKTNKEKLESWKKFDFSWEYINDSTTSNRGFIINLDNLGDFIVGWEVSVNEIINYE